MNLSSLSGFKLSSRQKTLLKGSAALTAAGVVVGTAAAGLAVAALLRRSSSYSFAGKVVFITGGSRGLGLALAEEFASRGADIAICARDEQELARAKSQIQQQGASRVETIVCDVGIRDEVERTVREVEARLGRIDVLVNNAGIIGVGPIENQTIADFEAAMQINFWSQVYTTLAALPGMRRLTEARVVNITSIGGKVSVPHLLPYCCAKFAAVGFSEGLRAELAKTPVKVVTIAPGLMRTGSHINAEFKGKHRQEFTWFALSGTNPATSISVRRAARQIADATARGRAELIITWQAELMARFHGIAPGMATHLMGIANRALPNAGESDARHAGRDSHTVITKSPLTALGEAAAERYNQKPA
jgi:short-subunit dehydrogenase